jgi:hypothetical protein
MRSPISTQPARAAGSEPHDPDLSLDGAELRVGRMDLRLPPLGVAPDVSLVKNLATARRRAVGRTAP